MFCPSKKKMSAAIFSNGLYGISCCSRGSFCCDFLLYFSQMEHVFTLSVTSFVIPIQKTFSLAFSKHFSIPWWLSCKRSRMRLCILFGMMMAVFFTISPSSMERKSRMDQYFLIIFGTSFAFSGHPWMICELRQFNSGSLAVLLK